MAVMKRIFFLSVFLVSFKAHSGPQCIQTFQSGDQTIDGSQRSALRERFLDSGRLSHLMTQASSSQGRAIPGDIQRFGESFDTSYLEALSQVKTYEDALHFFDMVKEMFDSPDFSVVYSRYLMEQSETIFKRFNYAQLFLNFKNSLTAEQASRWVDLVNSVRYQSEVGPESLAADLLRKQWWRVLWQAKLILTPERVLEFLNGVLTNDANLMFVDGVIRNNIDLESLTYRTPDVAMALDSLPVALRTPFVEQLIVNFLLNKNAAEGHVAKTARLILSNMNGRLVTNLIAEIGALDGGARQSDYIELIDRYYSEAFGRLRTYGRGGYGFGDVLGATSDVKDFLANSNSRESVLIFGSFPNGMARWARESSDSRFYSDFDITTSHSEMFQNYGFRAQGWRHDYQRDDNRTANDHTGISQNFRYRARTERELFRFAKNLEEILAGSVGSEVAHPAQYLAIMSQFSIDSIVNYLDGGYTGLNVLRESPLAIEISATEVKLYIHGVVRGDSEPSISQFVVLIE